MAVDFILGMNAKLYQGVNDAELATLTEVGNVKDLTLSLSANEADVTTRANSGWRATAPTLRECELNFKMQWKPSDAVFAAIKTAFLTSATICLACLTDAKDEAGASGPHGNFAITKFDRSESLEESISVDVTAKLSKFIAWLDVAGT